MLQLHITGISTISNCHYEMRKQSKAELVMQVHLKNNKSMKYYIREMNGYKPLIVLEIHIQSGSKQETEVIKAY